MALWSVLSTWGDEDPNAALEALTSSQNSFDSIWNYLNTLRSVTEAFEPDSLLQPEVISIYAQVWNTLEEVNREYFIELIEKHMPPAVTEAITH